MSIDDRSDSGNMPSDKTLTERAQDDFVLRPAIDRTASGRKKVERRLHLRAFDYWHALHEGRPLPLFGDLTPEGLLPFKRNCLLIEFRDEGAIVRFCGEELGPLLGGVLESGSLLASAKIQSFSGALEARLRSLEGRAEAAEFEFVDDPIECRGILLPFSARGHSAEFMMVVVNHHQRMIGAEEREKITLEDPEQAADDNHTIFAELVATCKKAGRSVVHPGATTRDGLYHALAEAYRFHVEASRDATAYRRFLRANQLYQQRRAPFTPALKLTFGLAYEKTRLTEYATALSYAARQEVGPDQLVEFLRQEPGGIKGCVARERAFRRGASSGANKEAVLQTARGLSATPVDQLDLEGEFNLVLVRRDGAGRNAVLAAVNTSDHQLDRAINQAVKQRG